MYLFYEMQRISIAELLEDEWFKKGYKPPSFDQDDEDITIDDVDAAFSNSKVKKPPILHLNVYSRNVLYYQLILLFCATTLGMSCNREEGETGIHERFRTYL